MLVRVLKVLAGSAGTHQPGEVCEFPEFVAIALIAVRAAEPVIEGIAPESAAVDGEKTPSLERMVQLMPKMRAKSR